MKTVYIPKVKWMWRHFTRIPNVYFDLIMCKVTKPEWMILCVILRKTYGWGKSRDRISKSQFAKITGMSHMTIQKALIGLQEKSILLETDGHGNYPGSRARQWELVSGWVEI